MAVPHRGSAVATGADPEAFRTNVLRLNHSQVPEKTPFYAHRTGAGEIYIEFAQRRIRMNARDLVDMTFQLCQPELTEEN